MTERVIYLYQHGQLSDDGLARAVTHGWITVEQYEELTGQTYAPPADYKAYHAAMTEVLS